MNHFLAFLVFLGISIISTRFILSLLDKANFKQENFLKKEIITSSGILFLVFLTFYAIYLFFIENNLNIKGWPYSILILGFGIGLLGFVDDLFGDSQTRGFAGHFGALAKGKITTGLLKAVLGAGIAFIVAIIASDGLISIIVNTLIIALSINLFNLLDLRPGRSLKTFMITNVFIFSFSKVNGFFLINLPVLAPVIILLYLDLQLLAMLGDAGSNILGAFVGLYVIYSFGLKINLAILLGLIIIHLYSEKHSISKFISNNSFLSWVDELGLKKN